MEKAEELFDRALVCARRDRVSAGASDHAFLLERVAEEFRDRLDGIKRTFPLGLNLGAYHGELSRQLRGLPNVGTLFDVELSGALLAQCDGPRVRADEESLPFSNGSLDMVVSGLSLQLVNDLPGALVQIFRALKPDGLMMVAMLGGETLRELREAWLVAEDEVLGGASLRVAPFADIRDIGALAQRAGFALPVVDADRVCVTYSSPLSLMRELRGMGASNVVGARSRRPLSRALLARVCDVYQERFGVENGRVAATFEIVTVTAWVPDASQQKPLAPGSATTRLANVLGDRSSGERG